MKACSEPGRPVWVSYHDDPKRKLKYSWQVIEMPTSLVGVNTMVPNRLVFQSIRDGLVGELAGYDEIRSEVKAGKNSRIDLLLTRENELCYVEVKNCTLVEEGYARFPDAVTTRGLKHLTELTALVAEGHRAAMFYLVQRMDAEYFSPADDIDPAYGKGLRKAVESGVEILVYDVAIDSRSICLNGRIPYRL